MAELPKIKTGGKVIYGKLEGVRGGDRNNLKDTNWRLKAMKNKGPAPA